MPPTWAILVPTLGERRRLFERLTSVLLPQLDPFGGRVQVHGWFNNGTPSLPEIRQRMVQRAGTDYVSFVDDDDLVSLDYVADVVGALETEPDYVGFQVQCYSDGRPTGIAYHSLKHEGWSNGQGRYYRDISHINPIRRDLALRADFRRARPGQPEDRTWADQMRRGHHLKNEVVLDRIVYHYLYSTSKKSGEGSRWQKPGRIHRAAAGRAEITSPHFTWSA